jgi:hypothetical protein
LSCCWESDPKHSGAGLHVLYLYILEVAFRYWIRAQATIMSLQNIVAFHCIKDVPSHFTFRDASRECVFGSFELP